MKDTTLEGFDMIQNEMPDLAKVILEVCVANVRSMKESLSDSNNVDNKWVKDLPEEKRTEMLGFYDELLVIFTEREMYEECSTILFILDSLQKV